MQLSRLLPIVGNAVFVQASQPFTVIGEAGVPPATPLLRQVILVAKHHDTGIAIANPGASTSTITFELLDANGVTIAPAVNRTLAGMNHTALFVSQLFPSLPLPFKGVLRISSPSLISMTGLRAHYNQRSPVDFLITTTPPTLESAPSATSEMLFPHLVDGDGYITQFILFSGTAGQTSAGTLRFFTTGGQTLSLSLNN